LFGLRVEDIDFARQSIRVRRSIWLGREVPTKTRKGYREVFIDEGTAKVLSEHLNGRTVGLLFCTRKGTPLTDHDVVLRVLYPLCDKLGIKRGGLHAFRHGRVSLIRASGAPDDLVRRQIGHSSLKMTGGYTHFSDSLQRELANKVNWSQSPESNSAQGVVSDRQLN
jgi:integrase